MQAEGIGLEVVTEFSHYSRGEQVNGLVLVTVGSKHDSSEVKLVFAG